MEKTKLLGNIMKERIDRERNVAICSLCGGGTDCSCGSCGICNCGSCYSCYSNEDATQIWY